MICQEVIELMQRYLDQDLDETEYNAMLRHLQQCDDCTELFQRLVSISQELEQLPKVTPAYSLVDAIMPRLDRIDAGIPSIDPPVAVDASQTTGLAAASEWNERKAPIMEAGGWRKRMRGLVSGRIIGGVVAAGLVLGFFIFEQQQKHSDMTNADSILMSTQSGGAMEKSTRSDASTSTSTGAPASKEIAPQAMDSAASDAAGSSTGAAEPKDANTLKTPAVPDEASPSKGAADNSKPLKRSVETKPDTQAPAAGSTAPANGSEKKSSSAAQPAPAPTAAPDTGPQPSVQGPVLDDQQRSQRAQPPVDETVSKEADASKAAGSESSANPPAGAVPNERPMMQITSPNQGFAASADGVQPKAKQPEESAAGTSSLNTSSKTTESPASKAKTSPDGAFSASLSEDRHVIINDKQGRSIFTSHQWSATAKVTLGEWTAENKITYQITDNNETATYVIDAVKRTEAKQGS